MQFVQPLLTDEQALIAATSLRLILEDDERFVLSDEERDQFEKLAGFFAIVHQNPTAFAPKGEMARTVKRIVRRAKGAAQPASRSRRKVKRSQGQQKRDRAARREAVAQYNAAREAYERDRLDHEEAMRELQEQFNAEPRVKVVDVDGRVIMSEIPISMVQPMEEIEDLGTYIPDSSEQPGGALTDGGEFIPKSKLILPGNVEKQMERERHVLDLHEEDVARMEREAGNMKHGSNGEEYQ